MKLRASFLAPLFVLAAGCSVSAADTGEGAPPPEGDPSAFSSDQATLLDFTFKGELLTTSTWNPKREVEGQMFYLIGHLNTNRSVARLDRLVVSDVATEDAGEGLTRIKYTVKIPVAWASKTDLPATYDLVLPKRSDYEGLEAFTTKYKESCVDWGAHDVTSGSFWYYYRPRQSGCALADADVVKATATAVKSAENSTGKYPEYNKVWEDKALEVVAIFGKYEDGEHEPGDAGIDAFLSFVKSARTAFPGTVRVTPEVTNWNDAKAIVKLADEQKKTFTFEADLPGGRKGKISAILVDNVRAMERERYESLSGTADLIAYNGHAGLGQNVRALANMGKFKAGQYQIFFMNGCDTFAYVDGSLAQARARLNPDDPTGTKYMEIVTNAMPSYFSSMPAASMKLVKGLLAYDAPKTYDKIFEGVDRSQVIVVTGEEDNAYTP